MIGADCSACSQAFGGGMRRGCVAAVETTTKTDLGSPASSKMLQLGLLSACLLSLGCILDPNSHYVEFYRMLPVRQVLLEGILGADLVSFNHFDYVRHFLNSCTR